VTIAAVSYRLIANNRAKRKRNNAEKSVSRRDNWRTFVPAQESEPLSTASTDDRKSQLTLTENGVLVIGLDEPGTRKMANSQLRGHDKGK